MSDPFRLKQSLVIWLCLLMAATVPAVLLAGLAALAVIIAIGLCAYAWLRWLPRKSSLPSGLLLVSASLASCVPFYRRGFAGMLLVALSSYLAGAVVVLQAVIRERRRLRGVHR
jgi:hypothetical protein